MAMERPRRSLPHLENIPTFSLAQYRRPDPLSFRYDAEDLYDALQNRPHEVIESLEHFDDSLRLLSESTQLAMIGQLERTDAADWNDELRWYHNLSDRYYQLTAETLIPLLSPEVLQVYAGRLGRNFFYHIQNLILQNAKSSMDAAREFRRTLRRLRLHLNQGGRVEHWPEWQTALDYHEQLTESFGFRTIYAKQQQVLGFKELSYEGLMELLREIRKRFVPLYSGLLEMYDLDDSAEQSSGSGRTSGSDRASGSGSTSGIGRASGRDRATGAPNAITPGNTTGTGRSPWHELEQVSTDLFYLPIYGTNASPLADALPAEEWFYQLASELMAAEFSHVVEVPGNYLRKMQEKSYIRFKAPGKIPSNTQVKLQRYRLNSAQVIPQLFYLSDMQLPVLYAPKVEHLTDIHRWFHALSEFTWQLLHSDSEALYLQFDGEIQSTLIQMYLGEAMSWEPIRENRYALSAFDHGRGELYTRRRLFQLIEEILVAAAISEWTIMSFRTRTITLQESFEIWPEILGNYGLGRGVRWAQLERLQAGVGRDGVLPELEAILSDPFAVVGEMTARILGIAYWDQLQQSPDRARRALCHYMDHRLEASDSNFLEVTGLPYPIDPEMIRRLAYKLAFTLEK